MAYVDANPFRAKAVEQPEQAAYASLRARVHPDGLVGTPESSLVAHLTPLELVTPVDPLSGRIDACALGLEDYRQLVRAGCGLERDLGRGAAALEVDAEAWRKRVGAAGMFQG